MENPICDMDAAVNSTYWAIASRTAGFAIRDGRSEIAI